MVNSKYLLPIGIQRIYSSGSGFGPDGGPNSERPKKPLVQEIWNNCCENFLHTEDDICTLKTIFDLTNFVKTNNPKFRGARVTSIVLLLIVKA